MVRSRHGAKAAGWGRGQPPLFAIRLPCFPVVFRTDGIGGLRFPWVFSAGDREMQEYRAYVIGRDGQIELRFDLFCSDDNAARERAWQLVDDRDVELWRGEYRIETFKVTRH
jgi:hypothetical protein